MIRSLALVFTLVAGLALAWVGCKTPAPEPASAPGTSFSAARAMADINELGKSAHPIDSVRHDEVRDYLMGRLKGLGLETRIQTGTAAASEGRLGGAFILGGDVQNLIGMLPGRDRNAKAVAVMAHYDSVPNSPGAADDGAGVASLLETARAIKAQGVPARDVIFLITDGEEGDLLGARAFYAHDPLAKHIGAVVNMDARGGGGRAMMFETGHGNGATINVFRHAVRHPSSTSLAVFMYEHMPNGTDFTVPKNLNIQGINVAFIGRYFDYHAASSTPARLEPGTLQDMGEQVLGMTHALAFAKALPAKAPDAVYADVFGQFVVAYGPAMGWVILVTAIVLASIAMGVALQRGETGVWEVARGAVGVLALVIFSAALMFAVRGGTGLPSGFAAQRPLLAQYGLYEIALGAFGLGAVLAALGALMHGVKRLWALLAALVVGAACLLVGHASPLSMIIGGAAVVSGLLALIAFGRPLRPWSVVSGFLKVSSLFALIAQIFAPTVAIVFVWPLAAAALTACIAALIGPLDKRVNLVISGVIGTVALGWVLALAHGVVLGVGADLPSALTVFVFLSSLAIAPILAAQNRGREIGAAALVIGAVLIGVIALRDPASAKTPRATEVLYVADLDHNRFERVDPMDKLDPWSNAVLTADGGHITKAKMMPLSLDAVQEADAKPVTVDKQPVTLTLADGQIALRTGKTRRLQLAIRSNAPLTDFKVGSEPIKVAAKPGQWTYVIWEASADRDPTAPIFTVAAKGKGTLEVKYASITPGWPADAKPLPARPADTMPWSVSDSMVETGTLTQSW